MRYVAIGVALVAAGAIGLAVTKTGAHRAAPRRLTAVRFERRNGWHVRAGRVHACPEVPRRRCEQVGSQAATVRANDCMDCVPPHEALDRLPPDGIAISVSLAREARLRGEREVSWPTRIERGATGGPIEGGPENVSVFERFGRYHGYALSLWVFFGRREPTQAQLRRAESELSSARLP